jgi:hypothetical protein
MSSSPARKPKTGAERTAAYRERMRAKGLVPKTLWVPDTKDPKFIAEYRRQAKAIAEAEAARGAPTGFSEELEHWPDDIPEIEWPKQR